MQPQPEITSAPTMGPDAAREPWETPELAIIPLHRAELGIYTVTEDDNGSS